MTSDALARRRDAGLPVVLLLLLIGVSGIGPIALNGVLPATSAIMAELATSYGMAQMVLTVYLTATLVSQIVLGPLADRHGRRPVMIGSLLVFAVGSVGCALAPNVESLLLARFVQGFGGAACSFLPRTIVRDVYARDRAASVIGYMTTAMMVAPMFGPALGGWVTDVASWRWMYAGLAVSGLLLAASAWRVQPETLQVDAVAELDAERVRDRTAGKAAGTVTQTDRDGTQWNALTDAKSDRSSIDRRRPFQRLLRERAFVAYALLMTGSVGVYYTFLAGAPYVAMESRGLDASSFGRWFAMVAIGYLSGNLVAGRFSEAIGVDRMIMVGLVPFTGGIALFWLLSGWTHPLGLFIPMQLVAFSNGMSLPNMISGAMSVRPSLSASASGLAGGMQTAFGIALTVVVGLLLPYADRWLAIIVTGSALVTFLGVWIARRPERWTGPGEPAEAASASAGRH